MECPLNPQEQTRVCFCMLKTRFFLSFFIIIIIIVVVINCIVLLLLLLFYCFICSVIHFLFFIL